MGRAHELLSRIRKVIKTHDPSYRLKVKGHICAKEWREIIGECLDFVWGYGYTAMVKTLFASGLEYCEFVKRVKKLQNGAKNTVRIQGFAAMDWTEMWPKIIRDGGMDVIKYAMRDVKSVN